MQRCVLHLPVDIRKPGPYVVPQFIPQIHEDPEKLAAFLATRISTSPAEAIEKAKAYARSVFSGPLLFEEPSRGA